jgi:anti-sigma-K factor RskA
MNPSPTASLANRDPQAALAEYALDILPPERRCEIEAALAGDPGLRRELAALREALTQVASTLAPVAPSPALRARLCATVAWSPR